MDALPPLPPGPLYVVQKSSPLSPRRSSGRSSTSSKSSLGRSSGRGRSQRSSSKESSGSKRSSSKESSGSKRSSSKETEKASNLQRVEVFMPCDWFGEAVTLDFDKDKRIGELKAAVCGKLGQAKHGYHPDEYQLLDTDGARLDDASSLSACGIKMDSMLRLSHIASTCAKKKRPAYLEDDEVWDEEHLGHSDRDSEEDEKAVKSTLTKALTSGGLHVRDLSPKKVRREAARKSARDRGLKIAQQLGHHDQGFASKVAEVAQQLFPSMFQCTPTISAKQQSVVIRPSYGGA